VYNLDDPEAVQSLLVQSGNDTSDLNEPNLRNTIVHADELASLFHRRPAFHGAQALAVD
jgi:hypothetical protein